jgi:hypothetical protein
VNISNGGTVTAITRTAGGTGYSSSPTVAISAPTTAGGVQATATVAVSAGAITTFTITNAGSGYVEQPTVTFSGGGGSGAAAYATVGSDTVVRSLGQNMDVFSPSGRSFRVWDSQAATTATYWSVRGAASGAPAVMTAQGETNTNGTITSTGTGYVRFMTNSNNNEQLRVAHTASAVNYVQVTGGAVGGIPVISTQGSSANIGLTLQSKSASILFVTRSSQGRSFNILDTVSPVNYLQVQGNTATNAPILSSEGSDTNIDIALTPKGTGLVRFGTYTGTALSIAGYIEIKDAGGTIRRLAVVA